MTVELAVAAASFPQRPPRGYWIFMAELSTGNSPARNHFRSSAFAASRAASSRWAAMSPDQHRVYNEAAADQTPSWLQKRADIDAQLRATGHSGFSPFIPKPAVTPTRLFRLSNSPTSREAYIAQLEPELAAAIKAHPRRAPYGLNMYARHQACKQGHRQEGSTAVCASGADYNLAMSEWKLMTAAQRQPWEEEGKIARQGWREQRTLLDARLKAAGHPLFPWHKPRASPSSAAKFQPHNPLHRQIPPPVKRYILLTDPALLQAVAQHPRQAPTHHNMFLTDFARSLGSGSEPRVPLKQGEFAGKAAEKWREMSAQQRQPYLDRGKEALQLWRENTRAVDARLSAGGHASFHQQSLSMKTTPSYDYIKGRLASLHKEQPSERLRVLIEQVEVGCRVLLPEQHEAFRKVGLQLYTKLSAKMTCRCVCAAGAVRKAS